MNKMNPIQFSGPALGLVLITAGCASDGGISRSTARGAGLGAAIGAAAGAIIGHQSGETGEGALVGAGVGGLIGGAAGHHKDKQEHPAGPPPIQPPQ